jgi:hypothetical protein
MVQTVRRPYMGVLAAGYHISCKLGLITKCVSWANTVPRSNDRNLLELPAFEICAFDKQFGEHSHLDCAEPFTVSLLGHEHVVVYPWYHVSQLLMCTVEYCSAWVASVGETDTYNLQPLPMHSHHRTHTQNECLNTFRLRTVYLSLMAQALLMNRHWTNNLSMIEHKVPTNWWVCTHGMGKSTVWALMGALCWNEQTSS